MHVQEERNLGFIRAFYGPDKTLAIKMATKNAVLVLNTFTMSDTTYGSLRKADTKNKELA